MNWTLHAMRDHNIADPLGGLGPRVERAPTPAPAPVVRPDGIVVGPDGKYSTALPLPEGHPDAAPTHIGGVPVWPFPTKPEPVIDTTTEEPGAHGFLREPLFVRVFDTYPWKAMRGIDVRAEPYPGGLAALRPIEGEPGHGKWVFTLSSEGKTWERVA